jgi:hypothetical protein
MLKYYDRNVGPPSTSSHLHVCMLAVEPCFLYALL